MAAPFLLAIVFYLLFSTRNEAYNSQRSTAPKIFWSTGLHASRDVSSSTITKTFTSGPELDSLLQNMAPSEKYALLIQSYATSILESSSKNATTIKMMESLFAEMVLKSIEPPQKASESMLTAAASFRSSLQLGRSVQLAKAGALIKYVLKRLNKPVLCRW